MRAKLSTLGYALCLLLLVWGWCGATIADERIVYRLKWLPNMSTVGDLYADAHGLFGEHGLRVTVKSGGPERDAIRELELGHADFGVASADQVIRAVAKGSPVVVIAQLFQHNPLQWMFFQDRVVIEQLHDLIGKRLGVTFGKNDEIIMRTLLARAKIDTDRVQLFSVRLDYAPFYKGAVDLWPVYLNTQGVEIGGRLVAAGEKIGFLNPERYGVHFVANSVVTSKQIWTRKPDLVRRFMTALLTGWRQALDPQNARQAIAVVRPFNEGTPDDVFYRQLAATRDLVVSQGQGAIGAIDHSAWRQTETIMLTYGQIEKPVDIWRHLKPID